MSVTLVCLGIVMMKHVVENGDEKWGGTYNSFTGEHKA